MKRALLAAVLIALAQTGRAETNWTGAYAGANIGYGWGQSSTQFAPDGGDFGVFSPQAGGGGFNQNMLRGVYGIQAGYNAQVWRGLVLGLEASYDYSDIKAKTEDIFNDGNANTYEVKVYSLASITPQVGYALGDLLLRAKGGLAFGRVASALNSQNQGYTFGQSQEQSGWTVGLGADYALTDHWIAGVAYDYYDLGSKQYGGDSNPDDDWPLSYVMHPIIRTLNARVSYKF